MISIIHPSRGRPEQAMETINKWLGKADNAIEYLLCLDSDDYMKYQILLRQRIGLRPEILYRWDRNKSAIEAINNGAKFAAGDLFVVVSDDFDCPEHWDTLLLEALKGKSDFCAKTIDGHQDWLITLPIMDRKYYERFGYVYHPDFKHMHCDLDLTCRAWMLGKYITLPLEFKHNHYSVIGQKPDTINVKNNSTWGHGKMLFNKRLANNFDLTGDLIPLPTLPKY